MSEINEQKVMSEAEQTAQLEIYMQQTKKALKGMSKNDLIRAVSALLIDKQLLINKLNRRNAQSEVPNATKVSDSNATADATISSEG